MLPRERVRFLLLFHLFFSYNHFLVEKPKWVSIPKQELQAAADAASASTSTSKRHPNSRKSLRHNPTTNNNPSASTSSQPFPQSRTSSTSHSRPESLHSSPNLARNGMKLPSESDNQGSTCPLDGRNPHSVISPLPDNLHPSPNQVDSRRSETTNDPSQPKKHPSALNYLAASRSQSHLAPAVGYSATSSRSTLPPQPTNLPQTFHATAPVFFSQSTQSTHSSANASNSSSPGIQHLHLLSPPASSSTSPQSLLPHPPFPHPHLHGQSTYPHAPYPLYNLSMPPMNSYDYASPDIAFRSPSYLPYPAPSNLTTLPHYNQPSSGPLPNGTSPAQPTDRNRVSPTDTLITKTNDPPVTRERMVFGSIDLSSANSDDVKIIINNVEAEEEKKEEEKKKKLFAIGVEDGHDLPGRSRPAQKKNGGKAAGGRPPSVKEKSEKKDEKDKRKIAEDKDDSTRSVPAVAPKVLTVEPRWTFGTTSTSPRPSSSSGAPSPSVSSQPPATEDDSSAEQEALKTSFSQSASGTSTPFKPQVSGPAHLPASSSIPVSPSIPVHPYHVHLHRVHSPVHASTIPPPPPPPLSIPMQMPPSMPPASTTSDPDLEVKDYGFGFGDASGLGYAPILAKERAREWEAERARERAASDANDAQALVFNQDDVITSPMTENVQRDITADKDNSIHDQREHFHSREHHFGRGKRGFSVGRGGYGDRGGAGSYRRPRGSVNGYPRGFGRGGGHYHPRGGAGGISPVNTRGGPSSPFNVTPPHHFQTLPLDSSGAPSPLAPLGGFYHPHPHHPNPGRPYIPPGYEAFNPSPTIAGVPPPLPVDPSGIVLGQPQSHHPHLPPAHQMTKLLTPPVPVPKTTISFPLDSTRYYLLGQLEYYLSAENMAQDFYLRQQVILSSTRRYSSH